MGRSAKIRHRRQRRRRAEALDVKPPWVPVNLTFDTSRDVLVLSIVNVAPTAFDFMGTLVGTTAP
jgi:hypothetical protein